MDAFYVSVERLDNPALEGIPVVVGGSPEGRGVVAAASYEARTYGVHSAMPMRTAMRLCPELTRVTPHFDRYRDLSTQVKNLFLDVTPVIEPLSLDEAFLDISEQIDNQHANLIAFDLKLRVLKETGLVVTVGGGTSKTVAKVASQVAKPNGLLLIEPSKEAEFLSPLKIDLLPGIGPKSSALLNEKGLSTIGDLARLDDEWLIKVFGKRGPELKERANGVDHSAVSTDRETKSVSAETTMATDVEDPAELLEILHGLVNRVTPRLQRQGLMGRTVFVKLRLANFQTFTRQTTLAVPINDDGTILAVAQTLLENELEPGRKFRLVGAGVTNLGQSFANAIVNTERYETIQ
jgi:DNA polymerase-4